MQGIQERADAEGARRYRGTAYVHGKQHLGPWTGDVDDAVEWRRRRLADAAAGIMAHDRVTLAEAVKTFSLGIADGSIVNRSGRSYKPSVIRDYRRDLKLCEATFGPTQRLDEIRLPDCRAAVNRLRKQKLSDSRVRNTLMALRAMYAWALELGLATVNPCAGLRLPITDARSRERIAPMDEIALLSAALLPPDRAAFALAWGAGLRAGELLAIDEAQIDLDLMFLHVVREVDVSTSLIVDPITGEDLLPKSKAGVRGIPISDRLGVVLEDHFATMGRSGLLFPAAAGHGRRDPQVATPMSYSGLVARLKARWAAAGLEGLGLHEARHTFASSMIAAGLSAKAVCQYMGHSSITITYDRYGHLFPGHAAEALTLLNAYHDGAQ